MRRSHGRARALSAAAIAAAALAAVVWLLMPDAASLPQQATPPWLGAPEHAAEAGQAQAPQSIAPDTSASGGRTEIPTTVPLADHPLTWLAIVDGASGEPVPGALVVRLRDLASICTADAVGLAGIPLPDGEPLAICADGYFLQEVVSRPGSSQQEPQMARLTLDEVSMRARFRFIIETGAVLEAVKARILPKPGQATPTPTTADQTHGAIEDAYRQHQRLAARLSGHGPHVYCNRNMPAPVFDLGGDAEVRFATAGRYRLEAATADGRVGSASFQVSGPRPDPIPVPMVIGRKLEGTVLDASGATAVAGVQIRLRGGDPLDLVAVTDTFGRFTVEPVREGSWYLELQHEEQSLPAAGPFLAGNTRIRLRLQPVGNGLAPDRRR